MILLDFAEIGIREKNGTSLQTQERARSEIAPSPDKPRHLLTFAIGYTELTCATASVCALRQTFGETECRSLKRRRKYDGEA